MPILTILLAVVAIAEFIVAARSDNWPETAFYTTSGVLAFGAAVWSLGQ